MTIPDRLKSQCSERDIGVMLSNLELNYGERKLTKAQYIALAEAWFAELRRFDPVTLHRAAQTHMVKSKHFPRLAELFALCEQERAGMADAVRKPRPNPIAEEMRLWRPPTPDERERVARKAAEALFRLAGTRGPNQARAS